MHLENSVEEELEILIRARYPVLYVVSAEESRVIQCLEQICSRRRKKLFEWSCTIGLVQGGASLQSHKQRSQTTRDPLAALEQIIDFVEPAIFVLKDFHSHIGKSSPNVIRRLKEIAGGLKGSFKTIVIVSPILELPVELEKEVTVLNFPPPGVAELGLVLDRVIEETKDLPDIRVCISPESRIKLIQASMGLGISELENVFAKIIIKSKGFSDADLPEILAEKKQLIRKSGLLEFYESPESFSSVGGMAQLKDWLQKRKAALLPNAREFGLPAPKGVLLLGVQGCGKSLCAKAVSAEFQLPLLRFDMGRMFGSLMGSSEENVRRAIALAESIAPSILWVDEIDKAFTGIQNHGASDGGTTARVLGTFLTWLSEKQAAVFVVATANEVSHLPPELLRKGRLDEIFFVDLPSVDERKEILGIQLRKRRRDPERFDLQLLAEKSEGLSGAEIEEAVISALFEAFSEEGDLENRHLLDVIHETVPLSRTMEEQIGNLRSWAKGRARRAA
ncbi:MAG: ftsH 2 [Verrucomicrobiales bacterium]|nr:ftsH 2 [Verrucomicrobiales bacterium]